MSRTEPLQTQAARQLLSCMDGYEKALGELTSGDMDLSHYGELSVCMEDIRRARQFLFPLLASVVTDFVLAHSAVMVMLWNDRMRQVPALVMGDGDDAKDTPEHTWAAHKFAIDELRGVCERFLARNGGDSAPLP